MLSISAAGRYVEDNQQAWWASVLFTKLVVLSLSILRLCPRTDPTPDRRAHWDYSSVASTTRNLLECYIVFFYLSIDKTVDQDEWLTRLNLIQLRDNKSRWQIFDDLGSDETDVERFRGHHNDLTSRLKSRRYFCSLPERRQNDLLNGQKALLLTHEEVFDRMGEPYKEFRALYKLMSAHTHTMPIAFYRMADDGRGNGVENPVDTGQIATFLPIAEKFLNRAINDMLDIFPDIRASLR